MRMMHAVAALEELRKQPNVKRNLSVAQLTEAALSRQEARLTETGALRASTGKYTGRSPKDKFIVQDELSENKVDWGKVNQPISEETFEHLLEKVVNYLQAQEQVFSFQGFAGADERYHLPIQVINEYAWHNLFARQLFIRPSEDELAAHNPAFTVISAPGVKADPAIDGTNSEAFVVVSFKQRVIVIGGTEYAGEMKKSIFSVMNFLLPQQEVMPMHCSANVGADGDTALFFGLSGTGKTTLSADPNRPLIGDDEHGWSPDGVFNIEGGCYAKCINLSAEKEPEIHGAIKFGTILENVTVNENGVCDYDDGSVTENTRAAYPIDYIEGSLPKSKAGQPKTIVFLTADATGVLPPISKLTTEQAMYHFLSGYTSKLAGTERGVTEPEATFSTCFGAPFLPLAPAVYAEMLGDKISIHNAEVYLVNTGWTGGDYHTGARMKLKYTRRMVQAALSGELKDIHTAEDEIFGLHVPVSCPDVPTALLMPENAWENKAAYKEKAQELATKFHHNFEKFDFIDETIRQAGPLYR
ncbi:phosphoenolpyruvate carboxykinase (ATP) [Terribacillus aidingensis]|uniref:Phosphoenolpyruvate carboxykinase (ATP) n=1 Tax=Terribacillus aidingensis TaxID=586416 RepID=A0A285N948_9BACI|nr:phosphoenolpyruvate carboxykinase (ATP) [Terribacillus aidingensis]